MSPYKLTCFYQFQLRRGTFIMCGGRSHPFAVSKIPVRRRAPGTGPQGRVVTRSKNFGGLGVAPGRPIWCMSTTKMDLLSVVTPLSTGSSVKLHFVNTNIKIYRTVFFLLLITH